ncbi:MAG TPA: hypothetical protein DIW31_01735 [Bacteroidales bacterium]|nr:hypothetical protein [Bacteroidales bacterium]
MKKIFTLILSLALLQTFGQTTIVMQVVSSAGGSQSTTNLSIDWTLGETVIGDVSGGSLILTQGFQQSFLSLMVSSNSLTVAAPNNSTTTFDVTSNINWTAESDQTWLTIDNTSGSGNATLTLTATLNPSTNNRSATVTVSGVWVTPQTILVTQSGSPNGIDEISNNSFSLYPNPATDKVWFVINNKDAKGNFVVDVFDIAGRKIMTQDLGQYVPQETISLPLSTLKSGVYLLKVSVGGFNSEVLKLIKK